MMKIKEGDIFTIPVTEGKVGCGQIVSIPNKNNFIIVVFESIYSNENLPNLDAVVNDEIVFFGYTMDALLYHKEWKIFGNDLENIDTIKFPYYKLGTPPNIRIVNYVGDEIRSASQYEFDNLNYKTVVAPIRYELALKAYHKFIQWDTDFDDLLYKKVIESISTVEDGKL